MPIVSKSFRGLYAALCLLFMLIGMSMTMIGATLPQLLEDFGWSYIGAGAVMAASAVGFFLATYFAGILVARIGVRKTILFGIVMVFTGLILFARTPSVAVNLMLNLAVGAGKGFIELSINYSTLRIDKSGSGRALNLIHGFFAVGAITGPVVIGLLLRAALPWTLLYRGIAGLFAVLAFTVTLLPFSLLGDDTDNLSKKKISLVRYPAYWLGFACIFLYVGVEVGFSNWITEYFFTVFHLPPAQSSFMVSLFWIGVLLGRMGIPIFYKGNRNDVLLISMGLLMSVSIIVLTIAGFLGSLSILAIVAAVLVFLAGLGSSVIYPAVITFVGNAFPEAQSEAIGFSAMGGGVGAFIFPLVMSNIASVYGIRTGFVFYAFFSIAVVLLCVMLLKSIKRKKMGSINPRVD